MPKIVGAARKFKMLCKIRCDSENLPLQHIAFSKLFYFQCNAQKKRCCALTVLYIAFVVREDEIFRKLENKYYVLCISVAIATKDSCWLT